MKKPFILPLLSLFLIFYSLTVTAHHEPATNKDGSIVTGVLTASFNPIEAPGVPAVVPFPSNLGFFSVSPAGLVPPSDLTLNTPVEDPDDYSNPRVALNALDGFSTTEKWIVSFADNTESGRYDNAIPGAIDPATVLTGQIRQDVRGHPESTSLRDQYRKGVDPRGGLRSCSGFSQSDRDFTVETAEGIHLLHGGTDQ